VHLTPREHERLLLAAAAALARRRLARGAPLGSTEAVALVCDEICELAWDGLPLADVIERARAVVPAGSLLPGVAAVVPVIEVEALFPWGSTLVHVDAPFGAPAPAGTGDRAPAAQSQDQAGQEERGQLTPGTPQYPPGAVLAAAGSVELAPGASRRTALLRNTGPRDVWISSHYPLDQVNPAVRVRLAGREDAAPVRADDWEDDSAGTGGAAVSPPPRCRLDLPAGEALLLPAGQDRTVTVIVTPGIPA
jgi:urease subunit gamma/beta